MADEIQDNIKKILENREYCPCLLLGKYATEFKRMYKGKVFLTNDLKSVREVTSNYTGISDLEGRFFVMDGIGFLSDVGQNALLKFVEESKFPIILLSYYDKVSPIILSRMKFIYKASPLSAVNLKFMKVRHCLEQVEEKEKSGGFSDLERNTYFSENCPLAYYLENRSNSYGNNSRRVKKLIGKNL